MIRNQWWRSNDVLYNVVSFNRHRKLPYQIFRPTNHNSNCRTTNLFSLKTEPTVISAGALPYPGLHRPTHVCRFRPPGTLSSLHWGGGQVEPFDGYIVKSAVLEP